MKTTNTPSEYYLVPRRDPGGESSPPNGVRRRVEQLRRGAEDRSARVLILICRRCQGREKFSGLCPRNFSARFLDKTSVMEEQFSKDAVPEREFMLSQTPPWGGWAGHTHDEPLFEASPNTTVLFRRRNNENSEMALLDMTPTHSRCL